MGILVQGRFSKRVGTGAAKPSALECLELDMLVSIVDLATAHSDNRGEVLIADFESRGRFSRVVRLGSHTQNRSARIVPITGTASG